MNGQHRKCAKHSAQERPANRAAVAAAVLAVAGLLFCLARQLRAK